MPVLLALAVSGTVVSCDDDDDDDMSAANYTISGSANGSQVVPSVAGTGTGNITGTYNPGTRQLNYTTTWTGLTGAPTSGGFYNGASGTNGTMMGDAWTFDAAATGTGTRTGSMILTDEQATALTNGNWYYGYGTTANTNGEVRGQITATR